MFGGIFGAIKISSQGLSVQRKRMDAAALNIANVDTTRTKEGGPYRRRRVVISEVMRRKGFGSVLGAVINRLSVTHPSHITELKDVPTGTGLTGIKAAEVIEDPSVPRMVYDPSHPDADENGYVAYPDINVITEMVDMIVAARAYEANITAVNASKEMIVKALEI
ncbi:MAG TPA: flagellar basal body rod protein FlgC [Candidatus Latescibacteria bacterium]|nr:flagellar basal body rod protein FlgC [Candidatus Latescibacterota bacterium]